jgi:protocatechuate 3,4-dioxygenase beta subunit
VTGDVHGDVLERNVRLLLRRSYVPALPAPHFRDRLESLFLAEAARRRSRRARPAEREARAWPRWAVAVAAGLVAFLLGWRLFLPGAAPTRESLLARGQVALLGADGVWRAAGAEERLHGVRFEPPRLVAVTPADAELEIVLAAGRVHVGERSELELAQAPSGTSATLRAGSAWFLIEDRRVELAPDVPQPLRPPPREYAEPLASSGTPAGREALAPEAAPAVTTAPEAAGRVLTGRVLRAADGQPVTDFTVGLLRERRSYETHPPEVRAFTSPDGVFRWPDPPRGKQRVFVHAAGHALCALGEHDLSGEELPELQAELVTGTSVRGSVLDVAGNPVAGALVISASEAPTDGLFLADAEQVFWLPNQARTAADGRFELAHLLPGEHFLRVSAPGFATLFQERVRVPRAAGEELLLELGPGGTVEGRVTREDGGPLAEAEIVIVAMDDAGQARMNFAFTRTDADGRYRFEHLPPTTMIVVMMRADPGSGVERPDVRPVQVVEGETITADFAAPQRGIRLHGRVLSRSGEPIVHQNLGLFRHEVASWNQNWVASSTQSDGAYAFEGVLPGLYEIYLIEEMGRALRCVERIEIGRADVEHDLHLPGGRLEVAVLDAASGEPVAQTVLNVMRASPGGPAAFAGFAMTDAAGRYELTDLRPGSYHVFAYPTRAGLGFARSEPVQLGEDERGTLTIRLETGGPVDVVVRDADGRPLEGAAVIFHDADGGEHAFSRVPMTDAAGRYRAHGLRPGRYRVAAYQDGYQGTPVTFHFEPASELEIPLVLAPLPR